MMEKFTIDEVNTDTILQNFLITCFFPKDTLEVSKYSSKEELNDGDSQNERNERDAKVIIFNPGSVEVEKSGSKKKNSLFLTSLCKNTTTTSFLKRPTKILWSVMSLCVV